METLKLTECLEFGNIGFRAITANCYDTLTNVDLSKSIKVDGETLGYVSVLESGEMEAEALAMANKMKKKARAQFWRNSAQFGAIR